MQDRKYKLNTVYFYISGECNLSCRHCWINPRSKDADLGTEEVKEAINQAAELGARRIKFTGGEPFLREDIFQILEFVKSKNLKIIIETNGTLIGEKEAIELKRLKVSFISLSIDSADSSIHDKLRGLDGAFNLAIRGLRALKNTGFSPQVIACIYRGNISGVEKLALLAQAFGAGSLKLNPIMQIGRAEGFAKEEQLLKVEELIHFEKYIQGELQPKVKIPILLDIPMAFKTLAYIKKHSSSCGLFGIIGVLSDGAISLCGIGNEIKELNMGNIKTDRLKDVWLNNTVLNFIRENIPNNLEGICGKCIFRRFCLGKCRADAYHQSKSLTAPFSFCQEAYEKGLFPKTRIMPN